MPSPPEAHPNERLLRDKKLYHPPTLTIWGDLRDVTLSPSPGTFESGAGIGFRG